MVSVTNQMFCLLQLDQLVVDAAKEKRDMEQKHSTIQQKVHNMFPPSLLHTKHMETKQFSHYWYFAQPATKHYFNLHNMQHHA